MSLTPEKLKSLAFRPRGIPRDKPVARDILGPPHVVRPVYCYMHCGWFDGTSNLPICPSCQQLVALSEKAAENVRDGNLPRFMTRTTAVVNRNGRSS